MAIAIYILCAFLSWACSVLLLMNYWKTGGRLLLWTGLCFLGLFANNVLLYVDLVLVPEHDLFVVRSLPTLGGLAVLIFGLIWESV